MNKIIQTPITTSPNIVANKIKNNNLMQYKKNDIVYIIGGGNTVNNFNLEEVTKDGDIIAINKSIEKVNKANYFITIDYTFIESKIDVNIIKQKANCKIFIANMYHRYLQKLQSGYIDTKHNIKYDLSLFDCIVESKVLINTEIGRAHV